MRPLRCVGQVFWTRRGTNFEVGRLLEQSARVAEAQGKRPQEEEGRLLKWRCGAPGCDRALWTGTGRAPAGEIPGRVSCSMALSPWDVVQSFWFSSQVLSQELRSMSLNARASAIAAVINYKSDATPLNFREVPSPSLFGVNTFNEKEMRARLPKPAFKALQRTIKRGEKLDPSISDAVATAMSDWALEKGATHYAHVFQPLTGITAEKHDSASSPRPVMAVRSLNSPASN